MLSLTTHSLRGRLLGFVLVAIFLAAVLQAATAYRGAVQQADALFDDHLQQMARSLRSGVPLNLPLARFPSPIGRGWRANEVSDPGFRSIDRA